MSGHSSKWLVVVVAVLAAGIPIGAVSAYHVGTLAGPGRSAGPPSWFNETLVLNGSTPLAGQGSAIINDPNASYNDTLTLTFSAPVAVDACLVSQDPSLILFHSFGECVLETPFSSNVTGVSAGPLVVAQTYPGDVLFVLVPTGSAAAVPFRWWDNQSGLPVAEGGGFVFVPTGPPAPSELAIPFSVPSGTFGLMVSASSASTPFTMVVGGSACCQRSVGTPATAWTWTGGYLGSGSGFVEILWSSAARFSVSVAIESVQ